jgi:molybdopterin converting factor small subunit
VRIRIRYLLWLSEKIGVREEVIDIDREKVVLEEIINYTIMKHPVLKKYLSGIFKSDNPFILLVNGKPGGKNNIVKNGDTIIILPPVSGG